MVVLVDTEHKQQCVFVLPLGYVLPSPQQMDQGMVKIHDGRCRESAYTLICFNWDLDGHGVVQADGLFHIAEKSVDVQRL